MCCRKNRRRSRKAFTLMEVLLVLVILAVIGSMAFVSIRSAQKKARADAARSQIGVFDKAVKLFELSMSYYPPTAQGLAVLLQPPGDNTNWSGPYLDKSEIPQDPWQNPYQYELIDPDNFRIWSFGPDGVDGTADDISNL